MPIYNVKIVTARESSSRKFSNSCKSSVKAKFFARLNKLKHDIRTLCIQYGFCWSRIEGTSLLLYQRSIFLRQQRCYHLQQISRATQRRFWRRRRDEKSLD